MRRLLGPDSNEISPSKSVSPFWNSAKVSSCAGMSALSRAEHTMQHHGATVQGPVYAGKSKRRDDSLGDGNGSTCSYNSNYKPALALERLVSIEIKVLVLLSVEVEVLGGRLKVSRVERHWCS